MIVILIDLRLIILIDKKEMIMEIVIINNIFERRKIVIGEIFDKDYFYREFKSLMVILLV